MEKKAIFDIGTNSIKFMIFSQENGKAEILFETNNISRLGEGLYKTGKISEASMARNIEALRGFMAIAEEYEVSNIKAVGTMCLRTASNSDEFIRRAAKEARLVIKVIPGEEEARLSYLAVLSTIGKTDKNVVVFDLGGGSTEFIFGNGKSYNRKISLNMGALQPTERFLSDPPAAEELSLMEKHIRNFFKEELKDQHVDYLVGIGGTATSMGAVMHQMEEYDSSVIHGSQLTYAEVCRQVKLYGSKSVEERKEIIGLQAKRARVILAGSTIVKIIMELLDIESLMISDRGLRHGLMFDQIT